MALEVEDGTGKANAEAYTSVAEADSHLALRGFSLWSTMSTAEKEQAIRRATDYMVQVYRLRWAGVRATLEQALDWPRAWVPIKDWAGLTNDGTPLVTQGYYASNEIPAELKRASADLAYKAAAGELTPTLGRRTVREKVDVIEVEYDRNGVQYPVYKAIDDALSAFFKTVGSGINRPVVRV
jgi:hypothetical protein